MVDKVDVTPIILKELSCLTEALLARYFSNAQDERPGREAELVTRI